MKLITLKRPASLQCLYILAILLLFANITSACNYTTSFFVHIPAMGTNHTGATDLAGGAWPQWHRIPALYILLPCFALIATAIIIQLLRSGVNRKKNILLQSIIDNRTSALQNASAELNTTILKLKKTELDLRQTKEQKELYYSLLSHDLRSPLKYLSLSLKLLHEQLTEYDTTTVKQQLYIFYQSAEQMYQLTDKLLQWGQTANHEKKTVPSVVDINALLHELQVMYTPMLRVNNTRIIKNNKEQLLFFTDRDLLHIILRNVLDNAAKSAADGFITIDAVINNEAALVLQVHNTGRHIPAETLALLNNKPAAFPESFDKRQSLGYQIIAALTAMLRGSYKIDSSSQSGTVLTFHFKPLR